MQKCFFLVPLGIFSNAPLIPPPPVIINGHSFKTSPGDGRLDRQSE